MTIDARAAAQSAATYYENITGEQTKLSIEEIELNDSSTYWLITLGLSDPFGLGSMRGKVNSYKIFKVDANTGDVKSMKIRKI